MQMNAYLERSSGCVSVRKWRLVLVPGSHFEIERGRGKTRERMRGGTID